MRPATFAYLRADTVEDASAALVAAGEHARLLAGGQTLVNQLRARTLRPPSVVDISRIDALRYVRRDGDDLVVGALTRMRDLEQEGAASVGDALFDAALRVADAQVRNRATVGGNLLNPDPISDIAPVLLARDGRVVVHGPRGERAIAAEAFCGSAASALELGEVIVALRFGRSSASSAFEKLSRRTADHSIVSAAATARIEDGWVAELGLALSAVHTHPVRARAVEDALVGARFDPGVARDALEAFAVGLRPRSSPHAEGEYRRQMAVVVGLKALSRSVDAAQRR